MRIRLAETIVVFVSLYLTGILSAGEAPPVAIAAALTRAGDNRAELEAALERVPDSERGGLLFLIEHMPPSDLRQLSAEFLLENVHYAYRAWNEAAWKKSVPEEIFLNNVLPYVNVSERRERWRKDFFERFAPLVADAKTPGEAAVRLNQKIFPLLEVKYSTRRRRADQAPYESIKTGLASCTGLSILLIDACRAVGVPARFVGTPRWSDGSGNHSWVEVWDDGWHFTGAAEPAGDALDEAWFVERASKAQRDHRLHAIYAVSYKQTPLEFPMVWRRRADPVFSVNVTDRYAGAVAEPAKGLARVMFRVLKGADRCAARLRVRDADGTVLFEGKTKDERFDANDHLTVSLETGKEYEVKVVHDGLEESQTIRPGEESGVVTLCLDPSTSPWQAEGSATPATASARAVGDLRAALAEPWDARPPFTERAFAKVPLSEEDAETVEAELREDYRNRICATRKQEMDERLIRDGELKMPFFYQVFGEKPATGRSLYISLHGGGNTHPRVNDRQWENQKRVYKIEEGVYLVPRAPTNTWNLWHQEHIDRMLGRLIQNLIAFEEVDPDRVYLLGYSAGGDGVYQLAPRMADQLAAAAMMAGHPNETVPLGLRNLPFTIHVGGEDGAYNRNRVAAEWGEKLEVLAAADPGAYVHWVEIYPGKGHWMDGEDAAALPWMAKFRRQRRPERIVWKQDDVAHRRFYWLALDESEAGRKRAQVNARRSGQRIEVESDDVESVIVRLDDEMLDLDQPVTVVAGDRELFRGVVPRTIDAIARTLYERGDPRGMFRAEIEVELPAKRPLEQTE